MAQMSKKAGFTLIELLMVVAIIGVLSSIVMGSLGNARKSAYAARLIFDLRSISNSWAMWQADTGGTFAHEDFYSPANGSTPCSDQAAIADTDLVTNKQNLLGWGGPYMQPVPLDPFGVQYEYDNDGDIYTPGNPYGGVNVMIVWCSVADQSKYVEIATLADQKIDGGDGWRAGRLRWNFSSTVGSISYLVQ